ncbi:MAG: hypothetical protein MJ245_06180 [Clostridia bacterium]|nr:hypothetical protein [Clostridia bacterium]
MTIKALKIWSVLCPILAVISVVVTIAGFGIMVNTSYILISVLGFMFGVVFTFVTITLIVLSFVFIAKLKQKTKDK